MSSTSPEHEQGAALVMRVWKRLPVVVRSVLIGILVLLGNQPPLALLLLNLQVWPVIPWSVPFAAIYLWCYWRYLHGRWWPRSTAEGRRLALRGDDISPQLWRWSLLAGGLAIASGAPLAFMAPLGVELPTALLRLPALTAVPILLTLSAVAGMVEEAAFRGYMQGPIEQRLGPVAAILVVSAVFCLVHLPGQRITALRMLLILTASVTYGVLAHITGSILPGIVLHSTGNAFGLCLLWWLTAHTPADRPHPELSRTLFWLYTVEAIVLAIAALWAFTRLLAAAKRESTWEEVSSEKRDTIAP